MPCTKKQFTRGCRLVVENALRFIFNLAFIAIFQTLFGMEHTLAAVALGVGITMLPFYDYGIRPSAIAFIIPVVYIGSGLAAQAVFLSPALAFLIDFLFVFLLMSLIGEPIRIQPYISFLLCFVFCQATPASRAEFLPRFYTLALGSLLIVLATLFWWRRKGFGREGRMLKEQVFASWNHIDLILRMSLGLAAAMLVGSLLGLRKPLWISIVVMSLTQLEFHDTVVRIKNRSLGTLLGIVMFVVVFRLLVPERYAMLMILALGYLSFFTTEYRYKQIVNAVCAINASMVLLDTSSAIANRILCLAGGILIVLSCYLLMRGAKALRRVHLERKFFRGDVGNSVISDYQSIAISRHRA